MSKVARRDFIRQTVIGGIGATAVLPGHSVQSEPIPERSKAANAKKIIVAGAGITGLCCAYELMKSGHDVIVLEANGRHGGHVFSGRDGLTDGLYADYGADHLTKPGYENFFSYVDEFKLKVIPYPNAEGSQARFDPDARKMIDGKWYTFAQLKDKTTLRQLGFNEQEAEHLAKNGWYDLDSLFISSYLPKFTDPMQPFGIGYDDLDKIPAADLFRKHGASATALRFLGGNEVSALFHLWRSATRAARGIPASEGDTFRLQGGNQELPNAFARALGSRVMLKHVVKSIRQNDQGVDVNYTAYGYDESQTMHADLLVNCIPLPIFRKIPVTPALSAEKQYVIDNLSFSSHPFFVFEAENKFWLDEGLKSINMEFEDPDLSMIWQEPNEVQTGRVILKAFGPGGVSPQRVLAAFRKHYPGKRDTIVQALTLDWTKDAFAPTCEMESFPIGQMNRFWPQVLKNERRIYFAGTYADNFSRGMESCIRSSQRVAKEINVL